MSASAPLPDISDILPHRGDMLLLDRLLSCDDTRATAEYAPRRNAWYADDGGHMPCWIGIELMAQTVAAHVGHTKSLQGLPPKPGVLLGTRRYRAGTSHFAQGQLLQIEAIRSYLDDSGLGAYECRILCKGQELASATVKVYEPADFTAFLKDAST